MCLHSFKAEEWSRKLSFFFRVCVFLFTQEASDLFFCPFSMKAAKMMRRRKAPFSFFIFFLFLFLAYYYYCYYYLLLISLLIHII